MKHRRRRPARKPARHKRHVVRRRPTKRKLHRRFVRRAKKAVRRAAPRPGKPQADPASFWSGGDLSGFKVEIAPAAVAGGTLKRLGQPPLGGESGEVERTLRRTYAAASALALSLARR